MAHSLHPTVSILFASIYRPGEQVGCTPSGVEKHSQRRPPPVAASFHFCFPSAPPCPQPPRAPYHCWLPLVFSWHAMCTSPLNCSNQVDSQLRALLCRQVAFLWTCTVKIGPYNTMLRRREMEHGAQIHCESKIVEQRHVQIHPVGWFNPKTQSRCKIAASRATNCSSFPFLFHSS